MAREALLVPPARQATLVRRQLFLVRLGRQVIPAQAAVKVLPAQQATPARPALLVLRVLPETQGRLELEGRQVPRVPEEALAQAALPVQQERLV